MTKTINPERGVLAAAAETLGNEQPVVMINLLKFNALADYPEGESCTGREAYAKYSREAFKKVGEAGGEIVYYGAVHAGLIVPADESWDEVVIVRYPSFAAFRKMVTNSDYQAITKHRTAALADSRLLLTQPARN